MPTPISGLIGEVNVSDGAAPTARFGRQGDLIVSELHGRFYEQAIRGNLYSGGMTLTSIANVTFTTGTVGATATPIVGVWNPMNSGYNLVILQAYLDIVVTNATNTGPGGLVWSISTGNTLTVIGTGAVPFNNKTLAATGSIAKNMAGAALTGLTTNLAVLRGSSLGGGSLANFSFVGTAVGQVTPHAGAIENIDGSIIVPPGGILGLFGTTTPVAHSATSGLLWEEVPV